MGGSGITIEIEATRADDVLAPAKFHRQLWRRVRTDIGNRLRRVANRQVLDYYLDAEASDGFASGQWSSEATGLGFVFHEGGGCVVAPFEGSDDPIEIFTDDGAGPLSYGTLTDDERARVDSIARTRQCACEMCERIRGTHTRAAARKVAAAAKAAAKTATAKRVTKRATRARTA